jgi:hypothetical protein
MTIPMPPPEPPNSPSPTGISPAVENLVHIARVITPILWLVFVFVLESKT